MKHPLNLFRHGFRRARRAPGAGPRWALLLLALGAAGLALAAPQVAGLAGYALLGGIARWSRFCFSMRSGRARGRATEDALRVAEAAAKANIAWAITGEGGAVLDCNPVYRRMAGVERKRKRRRRPNWRWRASPAPPCSIACRAMPPKAARARKALWWCRGWRSSPRCAPCRTSRPPGGSRPRLAASTSPQPVLTPRRRSRAAPRSREPAAPQPAAAPRRPPSNVGDLFRDAPMGVAFADAAGVISDANAALGQILRRCRRRWPAANFADAGGGRRPRPGAWP